MSSIDAPIPYGRQDISEDDAAAVLAVLRSDWLTQGPAIPTFEKALTDWTGAAHAVAVNSATSALHIACLALELGPGDIGWTVPISFVASANCILYCGADVDFVDVDVTTGNIDPEALEQRLDEAARVGKLPKVLIPVMFSGRPYDQARVAAACRKHGVRVIEDASHAIGAVGTGGETIGNGRWADLTVFSFHPVKIVTTAEGGAITTNDADLAERCEMLRSHGLFRAADRLTIADAPGWYYEQQALGFNYRITDLQAALGASQMTRLDTFVTRRNMLVDRYDRLLADLPVGRPPLVREQGARSSWHLYPLDCGDAARRRRLFDGLRARGIYVQVHYIPIVDQPFYRDRGFSSDRFPAARRFYDGELSIPMFSAMSEAQQDRVVETLASLLREEA